MRKYGPGEGLGAEEKHLGIIGTQVTFGSDGGYKTPSYREMAFCTSGPDPGTHTFVQHGAGTEMGIRPANTTWKERSKYRNVEKMASWKKK